MIHDMQSQGVGGDCIPMYIDFLREAFDEKLIAKVHTDNIASIKILQKAGAKEIDSEESDFAKFIKKAATQLDANKYAAAEENANEHYTVTFQL